MELCRTCMSTRPNATIATDAPIHKQYIYDKAAGGNDGPTVMELLQSVQPQLHIHIDDRLPKVMCRECIEQLQITHEFLQMCKDTDQKFRKLLEQEDPITDERVVDHLKDHDEAVTPSEVKQEHIEYDVDEIQSVKIEIDINDDSPINATNDHYPACMSNDKDTSELSDNPFGNSNENADVGESMALREMKSSQGVAKQNEENKFDGHNLPPPMSNQYGLILCPECDKKLTNVASWQQHMLGHRFGKISKKIEPARGRYDDRGKAFHRRDVNRKLELTRTEPSIGQLIVLDELKLLKETVSYQNKTIVDEIAEIKSMLRFTITPGQVSQKYSALFPIDCINRLEEVEKLIRGETKHAMISTLKGIIGNCSITNELERVLHINIIVAFNVDGRHKKYGLLEYPKFIDCLYRAVYTDGLSKNNFLNDLQCGFLFVQKRYHQEKSLKRKHGSSSTEDSEESKESEESEELAD